MIMVDIKQTSMNGLFFSYLFNNNKTILNNIRTANNAKYTVIKNGKQQKVKL